MAPYGLFSLIVDECSSDKPKKCFSFESMRDLCKLAAMTVSAMFQVRDLTREEVEVDLEFAGFIALSCPLKADSEQAIKEIQYSSHYVCAVSTVFS